MVPNWLQLVTRHKINKLTFTETLFFAITISKQAVSSHHSRCHPRDGKSASERSPPTASIAFGGLGTAPQPATSKSRFDADLLVCACVFLLAEALVPTTMGLLLELDADLFVVCFMDSVGSLSVFDTLSCETTSSRKRRKKAASCREGSLMSSPLASQILRQASLHAVDALCLSLTFLTKASKPLLTNSV